MLINEYCKRNDQSVNLKSSDFEQGATFANSGHTACTKLMFTRFGSISVPSKRPRARVAPEVLTTITCVDLKLDLDGRHVALCVCGEERRTSRSMSVDLENSMNACP